MVLKIFYLLLYQVSFVLRNYWKETGTRVVLPVHTLIDGENDLALNPVGQSGTVPGLPDPSTSLIPFQ
jgi:hypothetical protein